jgi:hypothetical protein
MDARVKPRMTKNYLSQRVMRPLLRSSSVIVSIRSRQGSGFSPDQVANASGTPDVRQPDCARCCGPE